MEHHALVGFSDGLTIPFALSAGLSQVNVASDIILVAGFAATLAGAFAMSIGGSSAQKAVFPNQHSKHNSKNSHNPVENLDLPQTVTDDIHTASLEEKIAWENELHTKTGSATVNPHPVYVPLIISLAYILGGLISLAPYYFITEQSKALFIASGLVLLLLFLAGYVKGKYAGEHPMIHAGRTALTGLLAGIAAIAVANIF